MSRRPNLIGQQFGRLKVIESAGSDHNKFSLWKCLCDCGNECISTGYHLKNGDKKSCGCLWSEINKGITIDRHGKPTHLYTKWNGIKRRCLDQRDKNYKYYGGRGITICDEWMDFESFHNWALSNGYSANLTIERTNNEMGYSPDNCWWASRQIQSINRRSTNNKSSGIKGVTWHKSSGKWYARIYVSGKAVYQKLFDGLDDAASYIKQKQNETYNKLSGKSRIREKPCQRN